MAGLKAYAPVDIHKPDAPLWPANIPQMTEADAINAARRLWRFSLGSTFTGIIRVSSGNRHNRIDWAGVKRRITVNPGRGWKSFIHELSHWFDYLANGQMGHSKHHARFEAKLIREAIKRGWLDAPKVVQLDAAPAVDPKILARRRKLESIERRLVNWQRKLKRAERVRRLGG